MEDKKRQEEDKNNLFLGCLALNMKALRIFGKLGTTSPCHVRIPSPIRPLTRPHSVSTSTVHRCTVAARNWPDQHRSVVTSTIDTLTVKLRLFGTQWRNYAWQMNVGIRLLQCVPTFPYHMQAAADWLRLVRPCQAVWADCEASYILRCFSSGAHPRIFHRKAGWLWGYI
jgi:hypothetical protein